jgi:hypothetical protein
MKKEFKLPQIELVLINEEDIIKTSGEVQWWPEGDPGLGA